MDWEKLEDLIEEAKEELKEAETIGQLEIPLIKSFLAIILINEKAIKHLKDKKQSETKGGSD